MDVLGHAYWGGGLLSGCATAPKGLKLEIRVLGVETEAGNDGWLSFQAGERVKIGPPDTMADGIRLQQPGELTFPVVLALVEKIILVSDAAVIEAMKLLLLRLKILAEPTGAVAPAAVLQKRVGPAGSKVGVIISGGNVDGPLLAELLAGL